MEFFQPILTIREEEVDDFVLTIVEAEAVPSGMFATVAGIEELVGVARKVAKTFYFILHSMTLHEVHDDCNTILVGFVNELLEFFRCTKTATCSKEGAYVVTETTVIGVFLNRHNLEAVVTFLDDTGKHIEAELFVSSYTLSILSHTDMAFVNKERIALGFELRLLPLVFFLWRPNLSRENLGFFVLHYATHPRRNTFAATAFPIYFEFVEVAMLHRL